MINANGQDWWDEKENRFSPLSDMFLNSFFN